MSTLGASRVHSALVGVKALEQSLRQDLEYVELCIAALEAKSLENSDGVRQIQLLQTTHADLLSGLESIQEVLQWIKIKAPRQLKETGVADSRRRSRFGAMKPSGLRFMDLN